MIVKKAFKLEEKRVKTVGMQSVIASVKQVITNHYNQNISFDELLKNYQELEYRQKHEYYFLSSLLIGILSGAVATIYINFTDSNNIFTVLIAPFIILLTILGIIKVTEPLFKKSSTRPYSLFIVPFEKQVIINKLQKEYNFSFDGTCDEKENETSSNQTCNF